MQCMYVLVVTVGDGVCQSDSVWRWFSLAVV